MVLSVSEIDRWQPEVLRSVVHAASLRANVCATAAEGLGSLPAFRSWESQGAEAAKLAIGQTRAQLIAHAEDAMTVARAADTAADGLTSVKARLYDVRDAAWRAGMHIEPVTSAVVPGPGFPGHPGGGGAQGGPAATACGCNRGRGQCNDGQLARAITTSETAAPLAHGAARAPAVPLGVTVLCVAGPRGGPYAFHCSVLYPDGTTDTYYTDEDESGGY